MLAHHAQPLAQVLGANLVSAVKLGVTSEAKERRVGPTEHDGLLRQTRLAALACPGTAKGLEGFGAHLVCVELR